MKKIISCLLLAVMLCSVAKSFAAEEGAKNKWQSRRNGMAKVNASTNQTLVNVAQVASWIFSDGRSAIQPDGNSGLYFPRGSLLSTAIFQDGLVWGGRVNDGGDPVIRVGGQTFSIGTVPGAILSKGVPEDLNDRQNVDRVWRVRRDYPTADLRQDAAELNLISAGNVTQAQIDEVRQQYADDWRDWPAHKGAPFYDANNDGVYTPAYKADGSPKLFPDADEPGVAGADQVVWIVANDLQQSAVQSMYGSPSIGLEMQLTMWAYRRSDPLGNIIFKQYRLIYKGTSATPASAVVDSMYLCAWADPDLGAAGDDFVGSDTSLSLGYVYNSVSQDGNYTQLNLPPPASGYDFFAGPLVADPAGEAIFGLKKRPGFRNLPMTTFAFFAAGQEDSDPTRGGDYNGTLQWWNLLRGYRPRPENPPEPWVDPTTNQITKFRVPGDPVKGTGWIDANPGDRRLLMVSGPFTMALGDTQEVVVAALAALGSDRLSSISVLKFTDRFAQEAFDNLFDLPKPPQSPFLTATELDGQIVLNWGENEAEVIKTELVPNKGYDFQGYNVYQLPSAGAAINQGVKLGTFDLVDEVTTISQETFDEASGSVLPLPVQLGKNTGVTRSLLVDRDRFREKPLINGQTYYFAVTAYNYNGTEGLTTKTLESSPSVVTVVPQTVKPGERLRTVFDDTLSASHAAGLSNGLLYPIIVDPTKITGDEYKVVFEGAPGPTQVWHLINTTKGDTLLKNQSNQSGDGRYLNVDGILVKVLGAPIEFASGGGGIVEVANPAGDPCGSDAGSTGGCKAFGGNTVWHSSNSTGDYYVSGGGGAGLDRIQRYIGNAVPRDFELRFTERGGWAVFAFTDDKIARVPFEIWDIGIATPNDPSDDKRMIPFLNENVATSAAWGYATGTDPFGGVPNSDWIYWMDPESDTPGSASYDQFAALCENLGAGATYPSASDGSRDGYFANFHGGFVYPIGRVTVCDLAGDGTPPPAGTTIRFITSKPNQPSDVFTFSTANLSKTVSMETAKQDVLEAVNVFPNPYLGFNRAEADRFNRYVTFNHLPNKTTIRIFTLAGVLVRTITKDSDTQFAQWDLQNERGLPAASGIYIAHLDFPDLNEVKVLKLAIVREDQFLRNF